MLLAIVIGLYCFFQVEDPLDKIQESVDQQKTAINNLQAAFEERLDYLENQLSTFMQNLQETYEAQSIKRDA